MRISDWSSDVCSSDLFTLVHAFHVPYEAWLKSDDVKEYVRAEAEKGMATFLSHAEIAPLRSAIEPVVVEGETGSIVLDRLERTKADLLVLGTHGRSGFAHATIGSTDWKSTRLSSP